jgi:hypothetical protein
MENAPSSADQAKLAKTQATPHPGFGDGWRGTG